MQDLIRRLTHWLTLLLGPGTGTHRAGALRHQAPRPTHRTPQAAAPARLPLHHSPYCRHLPLDGTDSRLVRPYLAAHEREAERGRQRHRRLALVLAADFGIDLDQHVVGAGKAAA
ncbi:hypothetical protein KBY55_21250 [Streptomyces sp. b94]|uniref:hypothetical protein n=1 Tax=Streptomyces sp. b94 TaxID=1827634 RepID=UPI001B39964B|nr:hypothetical protein [Streptomyces sp. b94]MBQ1098540.1 hypothetical protein [Streptomyces sp. b94]